MKSPAIYNDSQIVDMAALFALGSQQQTFDSTQRGPCSQRDTITLEDVKSVNKCTGKQLEHLLLEPQNI